MKETDDSAWFSRRGTILRPFKGGIPLLTRSSSPRAWWWAHTPPWAQQAETRVLSISPANNSRHKLTKWDPDKATDFQTRWYLAPRGVIIVFGPDIGSGVLEPATLKPRSNPIAFMRQLLALTEGVVVVLPIAGDSKAGQRRSRCCPWATEDEARTAAPKTWTCRCPNSNKPQSLNENTRLRMPPAFWRWAPHPLAFAGAVPTVPNVPDTRFSVSWEFTATVPQGIA